MQLPNRFRKVWAGAMLAGTCFVATPDWLWARDAMDAAARARDGRSAQAGQSQSARALLLERRRTHGRMPSTMYASTPDPAPPPHPAHVAVDTPRAAVPPATSALSGEEEVSATHAVGLFPSAADASGRQGFVRVVNHSSVGGEVRIDAYDDAGTPYRPLTLTIAAGETVHFNSGDLETGNTDKGLDGATGSGEGDWRLELSSVLALEVLAYIRTEDGFLTSMHDVVPQTEAGHRVVTFNPGRNASQVSSLRLINPGIESVEVRIEGVDDDGASPGSAVELDVPGRQSRTLGAKELESGDGVSGALGTGEGKWRLVRGPADCCDEPAVEPHRALDEPLDRAEGDGKHADGSGGIPRAHLRAGRAVEVHPLPRRGGQVGAYAAGVRAFEQSGPRDAQPGDVRALHCRGGGRC